MKSPFLLGIAKEMGETLPGSSEKASGYFTYETASHMAFCVYYCAPLTSLGKRAVHTDAGLGIFSPETDFIVSVSHS